MIPSDTKFTRPQHQMDDKHEEPHNRRSLVVLDVSTAVLELARWLDMKPYTVGTLELLHTDKVPLVTSHRPVSC